MAKLIFEGNKKYLEHIKNRCRLIVKRNDLKVSLTYPERKKSKANEDAEAAEYARVKGIEAARLAEIEATKKLESERIEAEEVEAKRIEDENIEAEKIEAENIEAEDVEAAKVESDKLDTNKKVSKSRKVNPNKK